MHILNLLSEILSIICLFKIFFNENNNYKQFIFSFISDLLNSSKIVSTIIVLKLEKKFKSKHNIFYQNVYNSKQYTK